MDATSARKERIYSRNEIEGLIADGRTVFILDGRVVKADAWRPFHPGGDKAMMHMVGRDATDEVTALHSAEAKKLMEKYVIGRIEGRWTNFLPPIQGGKFRSREELVRLQQAQRLPSEDTDSSSQDSSEEPSPIFEPVDKETVRRRRQDSAVPELSRSTSSTSVSSLEMEDVPGDPAKYSTTKETKQQIEEDLRKYPRLDSNTQTQIVDKYRLLNQRIKDEGLYNCNYVAYAWEIARYTFLFGMCLFTLHLGWYATSGLFLGLFWHQLVFTAHDAGHMGITHNFHVDTVIGMIIADYLGGLSIGWWKHNHNVHHVVTNSPEHDPDIEHMPFFAISHRFFESLRSTYYDRIMTYDAFARVMIKFQHYLYYPILAFGRFNLYRLSWEFLLLGRGPRKGPAWWHRWFEIAGHVFFWYWFGYELLYKSIPTAWDRFVFVMVSHMITGPLHVQITLSHFAMSTADLGVAESFPQRMLRTTMDVDCPQWLDFFHGGLQFQAIHHLYPRIPRHNLRQTQKLVQNFCDEVDIPYAIYGFVDGNKEVIGRLGDVAKQARILAECQRHIAETGDYH
ncbi:fatty acid desaturas-like protein [Myriangium duriaei CBS 260.36]|uniref:Delta 8-(E)-sphingolipid desaturase n=1 Tax=Myriangium duriaei CBS 260.36 TaxID=1168546 RepID=A0A9P4J550_9PEZI|nr:fatty acid desaturas-like protein [Myriangium duriaei CBS 260.36]